MALIDTIREQFPQYAWLLRDPEIGPLLRDAVNPSIGFSPQTFRAKVMGTNWWRRQSAAQRQWAITVNTDPGEAALQRRQMNASVRAYAESLGAGLSGQQSKFISELALQRGLSISDPLVQNAIANLYNRGGKREPGAIRTGQRLATTVARGEYFVPITQREAVEWGTNIGLGRRTQQDLQQWASERAMKRYPHLRDALQNGASMREIFGGHIATIAEELELSPERIQPLTGRWSKILDVWDPDLNKHRPMTLTETRTLARQDSRFWDTTNGKAMDSGFTNFLLQAMGERA